MIGLGFGYMALRNNERFEVSTFSDKLNIIRPAKGASMLVSILDQLNKEPLKGKSLLFDNLSQYKKAIKSKSLVVIISDFLFNLDDLREALYLFRKSEVYVVQVLDKSELHLALEGDMILQDSESDSIFKTFISNRFRQNYENDLKSHISDINDLCNQLGLNFVSVSTDTPIFDTFYRIVKG